MLNVRNILIITLKEKLFLTVLILITVIATVVLSLLPPLFLGEIIDSLTLQNSISAVLILKYFLSLSFSFIILSLRDSLLVVLGQKITHALRSAMMKKETALSTQTLSSQKSGEMVSRFISDVDQIELLFTSGIISLVADALQMLSILYVIFTKTKGLALLMLLVLPLVFCFTSHVQKKMLKAEKDNRDAVASANACIPETLRNILTIHNLNEENFMEERYDTCIDNGYRALNQTNFYDSVYSPVILILNAVVISILMCTTSSNSPFILALFGMSAGNVVTLMNYITQIFSPIESIGMEIQTIQAAIASVSRINEFLALPEKKVYEEVTMDYKEAEEAVIAENLSFAYDTKQVLNDMNICIHKGEHVTLSGRTGAGKSTLFKLILGLYEPESGTIKVCNQNPCRLKKEERRKIFGYVEQKFHPVPGTIRDQITLFDENITDEQVKEALKLTGLLDTVESFKDGIHTPVRKEMFSQGQWQILSITRAVVCNPEIMMLDEITSDLDAISEQEIMHVLSEVADNRTVISITHRIHAKDGRIITI